MNPEECIDILAVLEKDILRKIEDIREAIENRPACHALLQALSKYIQLEMDKTISEVGARYLG